MISIPGFSKNLSELIKIRQSWRTYIPTGMNEEQKKEINAFIMTLPYSPFSHFGSKTRFQILDMDEIDPSQVKQLGTYGFIKGARQFLVGSFTAADYAVENFAYLFELIILKATEMGLGTCWLGGSFNKSGFSAAFNKSSEENIPAVSPIGPTTTSRGFVDKVIRMTIKAKVRFPWSKLFFEGDFSTSLLEERHERYQLPLEMVRLAPSASNGQPWRILKERSKNIFHFYVYDPRKGNPGLTQFRRLDLGIAAAHFDSVCKELNYHGKWCFENPKIETLPDIHYRFSWIEKSE